MESFTTADWAKEIAEHNAIPEREPDGVTIQEFADIQKPPVSDTTARIRLNKLVRNGTHRRVWSVCTDGYKRWVYYRNESK